MKLKILLGLFLVTFVLPNVVFGAIEMEPVWVYSGNNWIPEAVSLGNHSSEVFSNLGLADNKNILFSVYDKYSPPNALWETSQDGYSFDEMTDVAKNTNSYAIIRFTSPNPTGYKDVVINKYTDNGEEWEYTFPFQRLDGNNYDHGIAVSDDGNKVTSWVLDPNGDLVIVSFVGNSNNPVIYESISTGGEPKGVYASSDGSRLLIVRNSKTFVMDLQTGNIIHQHTNWVFADGGQAFSEDGKVFAQNFTVPGLIRVYRWSEQNQIYVQIFEEYVDNSGSFWCSDGLGLSEDGNTLVTACSNGHNQLDIKINVYDLTNNNGTLLFSDFIQGGGQYDNKVTEVRVSRDGSAFAVGSWGDENFQSPVLRVYTKGTNGWSLYGTYNHNNTLGSAQEVEINAKDGVGVVVLGSKTYHNNQFETGGTIKLFNIGNGITLKGIPTQNQISDFNFRANAGSVIISNRLAGTPTYIPGIGRLYLDPSANMVILPPEVANSRGIVDIDYNFTQSPGTEIYAQALMFGTGNSRSFSSNYLKMTVEE